MVSVLRDRTKWTKPYYRLLFAMCTFDAFSSLALGLSTWPIPKGSAGVYAPLGTVRTCEAQAFFIQANIASPLYNFMLSLYFLLQVRYGMSEKQIGKRAEPVMHAITIVFGLGSSFLCIALGLFNDSTLWCWINSSPKGCDQSYENNGITNCERGDNAEIYRWAIFFAPLWAAIVGTMVVMTLLVLAVRSQENKLAKYQFMPRNSTLQRQQKQDRRQHQQSHRVTNQALRFVAVFYVTWAFATVNRLLQLIIGHSYFWLMVLHTVFVPLQGFFNFLVFIYPRYLKWKKLRSQDNSDTSRYGRYSGVTLNRLSTFEGILAMQRRKSIILASETRESPVEAGEEDDFVENAPQVTLQNNGGEEGAKAVDLENGSPIENEEDSSVCIKREA
eukprot:CAMPEP_0172327360 /NCGR_PEP_ID=MMETSP1058-20130122/59343_1 /TAXON_ID=83371 /ORGANISM="Detonula confervacea, Strain CCMP 353" /LENGTH=387 /DNA_ID=CAMNT_0013044389 /DNA_START=120 /DNA_END=1283 /DNA_ORIENTATION=+